MSTEKTFEDREYQREAIQAAFSDLKKCGRSLWWMPTGSGKAYCMAVLVSLFLKDNPGARVLVVIDQGNLVRQLHDTFSSVLNGISISIACAGISKTCDQGAKVIIGTRQTIVGIDFHSWYFDLLIGDEVHEWRLADTDREDHGDGQFFTIINRLLKENRNLRIHGCTATPYRLKDGWIFGENHRDGLRPVFPKLSYGIKYKTLFESGHLVTPVFMKIDSGLDRSSLDVSSSTGDFLTESASRAGQKHAKNAAKAFLSLSDRPRYTVAFCADTNHCKAVYDAFNECGVAAYLYHSKNKQAQNEESFSSFAANGGVLITVEMATKGFDFPPMECALLLSPRQATAAVMQQIGRILRTSPGKTTATVIDLAGNVSALIDNNDLDSPFVPVPPPPRPDDADVLAQRRMKRCANWPGCMEVLDFSVKTCPCCGHVFTGITDYDGQELGEFIIFTHGQSEPDKMMISSPQVESSFVRSGDRKAVLRITITSMSGKKRIVNLFFPDSFGFNNGLVFNSKRVFKLLTGRAAPNQTMLAAKIPLLKLRSILLAYANGRWSIRDVETDV